MTASSNLFSHQIKRPIYSDSNSPTASTMLNWWFLSINHHSVWTQKMLLSTNIYGHMIFATSPFVQPTIFWSIVYGFLDPIVAPLVTKIVSVHHKLKYSFKDGFSNTKANIICIIILKVICVLLTLKFHANLWCIKMIIFISIFHAGIIFYIESDNSCIIITDKMTCWHSIISRLLLWNIAHCIKSGWVGPVQNGNPRIQLNQYVKQVPYSNLSLIKQFGFWLDPSNFKKESIQTICSPNFICRLWNLPQPHISWHFSGGCLVLLCLPEEPVQPSWPQVDM